jgi:hypothetical protein
LLLLFLKFSLPDGEDFEALMGNWIVSLEYENFTVILFELAKQIGVNADLKAKVIGWIREGRDTTDVVLGEGICYLASITRCLESWEAAGVIANLFLAQAVSQTAVIGAISIVRWYIKFDSDQGFFAKAIDQIVSAAWTGRVVPGNDDLLGGACVEVIHILFTQGHIDQAELLWDIAFVNA